MNLSPVKTEDTENVASIFKGFQRIAEKHNFPYDFPTVESAVSGMAINNPDIYGVIAEENGKFSARIFFGNKIQSSESDRSRSHRIAIKRRWQKTYAGRY